jgi:hypothetical protein
VTKSGNTPLVHYRDQVARRTLNESALGPAMNVTMRDPQKGQFIGAIDLTNQENVETREPCVSVSGTRPAWVGAP